MIKIVRPTPNASSRTRNRLREHTGPLEVRNICTPVCLNGREAAYIHHPGGWFGWLPLDEIVMTDVPEPQE